MEKQLKYGKNGNVLVGRRAHPVRCYDENNMPIRTFKTLRDAADWVVHNGWSASRNAAQVGITHAINGKQHYWGKDFYVNHAYGMTWKSV